MKKADLESFNLNTFIDVEKAIQELKLDKDLLLS